jgi:hypothetical protein
VRVTVLSGQWNLVSDKYLVLPGADDLCDIIGTPATSSPIASTSSQNKPKKKKKRNSSNVEVCYNHIMPMGVKISFIYISLENPSLLTLCICCNFMDCAYICFFFFLRILFLY